MRPGNSPPFHRLFGPPSGMACGCRSSAHRGRLWYKTAANDPRGIKMQRPTEGFDHYRGPRANKHTDPHERPPPTEIYGPEYYASHCGPFPYERSPYWLTFFGKTAEELVRSLRPKRVFDAGCALGLLVEAFWDRGVEAHGRDVSRFAIGNVRSDLRPYCQVGSIADPILGEYDLVTCIEVLEHMPEELALQAIRSITAAAPRVFFSSSPDDFDEPTHINVRPPIYWLRHFAEARFSPVLNFDPTFLCHHAILLERVDGPIDERLLLGAAEIIRLRLEILRRDKHLVAEAKNTAELLEFKRGVYRNPLFLLVRLSNRIANAFRNIVRKQIAI
jgi:SAM-dependent methyltransferase